MGVSNFLKWGGWIKWGVLLLLGVFSRGRVYTSWVFLVVGGVGFFIKKAVIPSTRTYCLNHEECHDFYLT